MKKLLNKENLMQLSTYMVIAAIIFKEISWLPKLAGVLLVISSVCAIIEYNQAKKHSIKYLLYLLLILAGIYLIIE